MMTDFF